MDRRSVHGAGGFIQTPQCRAEAANSRIVGKPCTGRTQGAGSIPILSFIAEAIAAHSRDNGALELAKAGILKKDCYDLFGSRADGTTAAQVLNRIGDGSEFGSMAHSSRA